MSHPESGPLAIICLIKRPVSLFAPTGSQIDAQDQALPTQLLLAVSLLDLSPLETTALTLLQPSSAITLLIQISVLVPTFIPILLLPRAGPATREVTSLLTRTETEV